MIDKLKKYGLMIIQIAFYLAHVGVSFITTPSTNTYIAALVTISLSTAITLFRVLRKIGWKKTL